MIKRLKTFTICLFLALTFALPHANAAAMALPEDKTAAVILAYHRIGEDRYPATSIRLSQFETHIRELVEGDYNVMALPDVMQALRKGNNLPPRTVVLTFDGGHKSVLTKAVPLLLENNLPFTVFVSTDLADLESPRYMDWNDIKRLDRNKLVTVGLHPARYARLYNEPEAEIKRQLNNARLRYRAELGKDPEFFAYPFGEHGSAYRDIIESQGYKAALGQQSGVAYKGADFYALPRFTMTESYGGPDRFRLAANALPLPVTDIEPADPLLTGRTPDIGFTLHNDLAAETGHLSCFVSGQGRTEIEVMGQSRIEVSLEKPLEDDRIRVNCTMPGPPDAGNDQNRWRWFGMLLTLPHAPKPNLWDELENGKIKNKAS